MVARARNFLQQGINCYVPKMQYAHDILMGAPSRFSLGTPAAVSVTAHFTGLDAQATVGTRNAFSAVATMDGTYGRTITLSPSGNPGNAASIDVFGEDYLGQPMVERFTGASGSTATLYGKKAFKRLIYWKVVVAASNAVTWRVGSGWRLGLPYKGDVEWAMENGSLVELYKRPQQFFADRSAVLAAAGGSKWLRMPFPGYVDTLIGTPDGGGGATDPVITVELGNTAIVGLTVTVDTSDTNGVTVTDTPTTIGYNANNRFRAGDFVELVGAAASGAFGDRLGIIAQSTQFSIPDVTDPQTTTTGDPRGTYEALLAAYDGVKEIVVGLVGDNSYNSSGNGGLHGIRHVIA